MKSICPHYIHLPSCTEWFLCTLPHCTPSEKQLLMNRFTIRRQTDPALLPLLRVPSFQRHNPVQEKPFLLNHVVASKTQTQGAPSKMTKANCIAQLSQKHTSSGGQRACFHTRNHLCTPWRSGVWKAVGTRGNLLPISPSYLHLLNSIQHPSVRPGLPFALGRSRTNWRGFSSTLILHSANALGKGGPHSSS